MCCGCGCGAICCCALVAIGLGAIAFMSFAWPITEFRPHLTIKSVEVGRFSASALKLKVHLSIVLNNPNSFGVTITEGSADVMYDTPEGDLEVGSIEKLPYRTIPANQRAELRFPMLISMNSSSGGGLFMTSIAKQCIMSRQGWEFRSTIFLWISAGWFPFSVPIVVPNQMIHVNCPAASALVFGPAKRRLLRKLSGGEPDQGGGGVRQTLLDNIAGRGEGDNGDGDTSQGGLRQTLLDNALGRGDGGGDDGSGMRERLLDNIVGGGGETDAVHQEEGATP